MSGAAVPVGRTAATPNGTLYTFLVDPRISRRTKRSTTAPIKATKIVPPIPPMGLEMPRMPNSQPPMKAPTMAITISPMIPYPVPPITSDARTPATRPTTIQASIPIVSALEKLLKSYGAARQIVASAQALLLAQDTPSRAKHQHNWYSVEEMSEAVDLSGRLPGKTRAPVRTLFDGTETGID